MERGRTNVKRKSCRIKDLGATADSGTAPQEVVILSKAKNLAVRPGIGVPDTEILRFAQNDKRDSIPCSRQVALLLCVRLAHAMMVETKGQP
jgi:hypothetical protein